MDSAEPQPVNALEAALARREVPLPSEVRAETARQLWANYHGRPNWPTDWAKTDLWSITIERITPHLGRLEEFRAIAEAGAVAFALATFSRVADQIGTYDPNAIVDVVVGEEGRRPSLFVGEQFREGADREKSTREKRDEIAAGLIVALAEEIAARAA